MSKQQKDQVLGDDGSLYAVRAVNGRRVAVRLPSEEIAETRAVPMPTAAGLPAADEGHILAGEVPAESYIIIGRKEMPAESYIIVGRKEAPDVAPRCPD